MIYTLTFHTKIHLVLVFNSYLIRCYGLHILVQMYMDVQLDGKKDKGQRKSTCLHNEMDDTERHSLNRYGICD